MRIGRAEEDRFAEWKSSPQRKPPESVPCALPARFRSAPVEAPLLAHLGRRKIPPHGHFHDRAGMKFQQRGNFLNGEYLNHDSHSGCPQSAKTPLQYPEIKKRRFPWKAALSYPLRLWSELSGFASFAIFL
jgi:hypothetical protein